jgi:hypothetical protein
MVNVALFGCRKRVKGERKGRVREKERRRKRRRRQ